MTSKSTASKKKGTSKGKGRGKKSIGQQGKRIMQLAKQIRKKHPNKKWTECVSMAAKELKK